jgi:hypothetical protein
MPDGAFAVEIVSPAEPILPKIDLILGPEGLEWAEEPSEENRDPKYNELIQSILMGILMQKGDYRYNRAKGVPWVQHDKMPREWRAILGSAMTPQALQYIETRIMVELPKADNRVVRIEDVKAEIVDAEGFAHRRVRVTSKFYVVTGELVTTVVEAAV